MKRSAWFIFAPLVHSQNPKNFVEADPRSRQSKDDRAPGIGREEPVEHEAADEPAGGHGTRENKDDRRKSGDSGIIGWPRQFGFLPYYPAIACRMILLSYGRARAHNFSLGLQGTLVGFHPKERYRRGRTGLDSKSSYPPKGGTWVRIPPSPPEISISCLYTKTYIINLPFTHYIIPHNLKHE